MKTIYYKATVLFLIVLIIATGCTNYDEINTNPNNPTKANSSLLASGLIGSLIKSGTSSPKTESNSAVLVKQIIWAESNGMSQQWNGSFGRIGFGSYSFINAVKDMLDYEPDNSSYKGLAHFVKAYKLYYLSIDLGDIPYTDIGGAEEGNITPKYDTQKDVMINILKDLDMAYAEFNKGNGKLGGDFVFNGNLEKWKKTVTAFQLKVLINLSKKVDDSDLNIKSKFNEVMKRGLMSSNEDNFQLTYLAKEGHRANIYDTNFTICPIISKILIDMLKDLEDYRLFYYANPSKKLLEGGKKADEYDAYVGVDHTITMSEVDKFYSSEEHCRLNYRLTEYALSEPMIKLGYGEQQLILAEACLRGWIPGNTSDYYNSGIKANMRFTKEATPERIAVSNKEYKGSYDPTHGRPITDEYISNYVNNEKVKLTGNFEKDLEKIIHQKYIMSFFLQYMYEVYYDYRRTGYPKFAIDPATNQNPNANFKDKMPIRYKYPSSEISYNKDNVNEAIVRQFGDVGNDEVNQKMWILK